MKTKKFLLLVSLSGFLPLGLFGVPLEDAASERSVVLETAAEGTAS